MIGIEFKSGISAKSIVFDLLERGIITCTAGENAIRLLPPYIITKKEIINFLHTFAEILSKTK